MMNESEIAKDVKQVLDITSRVDERIKLVQQSQKDLISKQENFSNELNNLKSRVLILESKDDGDQMANKILELDKRGIILDHDLQRTIISLIHRIEILEGGKKY